jgi:hypothetical protein
MSKFAGLALVDYEHPRRMTILDPRSDVPTPMVDKDGKEAFIDLHSFSSVLARKYHDAKRRAEGLQQKGKPPTHEESMAAGAELLAALTTDWYLVDGAGDKLDDFSAQNAVELYGNVDNDWLVKQVSYFAGNQANFAKASSKN